MTKLRMERKLGIEKSGTEATQRSRHSQVVLICIVFPVVTEVNISILVVRISLSKDIWKFSETRTNHTNAVEVGGRK